MKEYLVENIATGERGGLISLSVNRSKVIIEWAELPDGPGSRLLHHRDEYCFKAEKPLFRIYQDDISHEW